LRCGALEFSKKFQVFNITNLLFL